MLLYTWWDLVVFLGVLLLLVLLEAFDTRKKKIPKRG